MQVLNTISDKVMNTDAEDKQNSSNKSLLDNPHNFSRGTLPTFEPKKVESFIWDIT